MKKLMVSGALALALTSSAVVAEESGAFVGLDLGISNAVMTQEMTVSWNGNTNTLIDKTTSVGNFRYGLMGGYKWFFTESFGLRTYLQVNNGTNYSPIEETHVSISTLNVMANVDALYNFYTSEQSSAGLFAGLSFGYAIHYGDTVDAMTAGGLKDPSGFDMGINLGLRTIFAKHHGVEFFNRFGVVGASATTEQSGDEIKMSILQPYAFGVRYTYNF
ncbi:outer membrane beta-barrel protein [uncultured Helicobacter sp.]|uniref:outer membrane beta-barrel protein n=1 Tax=uncultured Helicobacter sp. TaxID=175537 RepID=UPI00374E642E